MAAPGNQEELSQRERDVVAALARPLNEGGADASPATNQAIADEVFLSLDAVKGHLRTTYAKLGLDSLPQNEKRTELARLSHSGELDALMAERSAAAAAPVGHETVAPAAPARRRLRRFVPAAGLAALALAVLAALALAGVVPTPGGGDDPVKPKAGLNQQRAASAPAATTKKSRPKSILFGDDGGLLPAEYGTDEVVGDSGPVIEDGGTVVVGAPGTRGKALGHAKNAAGKARSKVKHAAEQVQQTVTTPRRVATTPTRTARHCVNRTQRVRHRKVVYRRVPRRVRVRVAHRHVRIIEQVYYTRKRIVYYDSAGVRHVRHRRVRHVRTIRQPYFTYTHKYVRRLVRVRRVIYVTQLVTHRVCS